MNTTINPQDNLRRYSENASDPQNATLAPTQQEIVRLRKALCRIGTMSSQDDGRFSQRIQDIVERALAPEDKI